MNRSGATEPQLKKAIEQQLDLILKIEEDRKLLKRQNKSLNQKYLKLTQTLKKYSTTQKTDQSTLTEEVLKQQKTMQIDQITQTFIQTRNRGCQVDLIEQKQQQNISILNNTSKLTEAMSFLKAIDTTQIQQSSRIVQEKQAFGSNSSILNNQSLRKINDRPLKQQKNSQISNQVIKMSKQMAALKRELKQSQTKSKLKQKQLKDLRKCLQTKSEALQKCRKQFNQLSLLLNTDKYKSIRNLETQNEKLRIKSSKIDDQSSVIQNLKQMLENVANQYNSYREQKQRKTVSLIKQLKQKDQTVQELQIKLGQYKNELNLIKY